MIRWREVIELILILPVFCALFYWWYHDIKEWWQLKHSSCKYCIYDNCNYNGTDIVMWSGCPRKRI